MSNFNMKINTAFGHVLVFQFRVAYLNSSHTVAYNPNARRAYEKSQHAEDFGRIKINLFL